jgi:hypothetical protein
MDFMSAAVVMPCTSHAGEGIADQADRHRWTQYWMSYNVNIVM